MRKFLSIITVVFLVLSLFAFPASATVSSANSNDGGSKKSIFVNFEDDQAAYAESNKSYNGDIVDIVSNDGNHYINIDSQYVTKDNTALIFESDGKGAARAAAFADKKDAVKVMFSCKWGHIQSDGEFAAVYDEKIQSSGNFSGNIVLRLSAEKVYDK